MLREVGAPPLVLLCTDRPRRGAGADALEQVVGPDKPIRALIEMLRPSGLESLRALGKGDGTSKRRSGSASRGDPPMAR